MSADSFVAFFGLRLPLSGEDADLAERRQHPVQRSGLDTYWGVFDRAGTRFLFVGKKLGVLGAENRSELELTPEELARITDETRSALEAAGLPSSEARLWLQYEPD